MKKKTAEKKPKTGKRRILEWTLQLGVLLVAVVVMGAWQTRNMVESGEPAPSFALEDIDGNPVDLTAAEGRRTVLYFFAPWCSVCHAASHNINDLRAAYAPEELAIYAIGLSWETPDQLKRFQQKHGLTVPVLIGTEQTAAAYRVSSFPSIYILDDTHRIAHRLVGYTTEWGLRLRTAFAGVF